MATKKQLRDELFAIKFALRDALLYQVHKMGDDAREDDLFKSVFEVWRYLNSQDYK